MFSIGDPRCLETDDPKFSTEEAAEIAALERSGDSVVAVYMGDGEIISLCFQYVVYRP